MNVGVTGVTIVLFACLYYVVSYILLYPIRLVMRLAK